jgi:transcriptional regulator with XRE-family HTH domain
MPAAAPLTKRVRALLAARGLTVDDMAEAIGRNKLTIRNVLTESKLQIPTRQAITDFLGTEIFPGIRPNLKSIGFKLPIGTRIIFPAAVAANLFASRLRDSADSRGTEVVIRKPVIIRLPFD